jgi:hypothetical protein
MEHRNSQEIRAPRPSQTLGARRTAMRMMNRKSTGVTAVYEQDPMAQDAGIRTLVFESIAGCTRVTKYPADWGRLSDDELAALRRAAS